MKSFYILRQTLKSAQIYSNSIRCISTKSELGAEKFADPSYDLAVKKTDASEIDAYSFFEPEIEKNREDGREELKSQVVSQFLAKNYDAKIIADFTGCSIEEIKNCQKLADQSPENILNVISALPNTGCEVDYVELSGDDVP